MCSALMLIAVSMKANSTQTVGTTDQVIYEANADNLTYETAGPGNFSSGRRAGKAAGRAIRGIVNAALLAGEAAYYYFAGDKYTSDLVLYPESAMTDFDN